MSKPVRIAIADDEEKICELLEAVLSDAGYSVDTFSYSLACLSAIKTGDYDMLITDLKMPVMDGLDLAVEAGLSIRLRKIGIPDCFCESGSLPWLAQRYRMTAADIAAAAQAVVK